MLLCQHRSLELHHCVQLNVVLICLGWMSPYLLKNCTVSPTVQLVDFCLLWLMYCSVDTPAHYDFVFKKWILAYLNHLFKLFSKAVWTEPNLQILNKVINTYLSCQLCGTSSSSSANMESKKSWFLCYWSIQQGGDTALILRTAEQALAGALLWITPL